MSRPNDEQDADLLVRSNWVAAVPVADDAVAFTHVLGRRRLVCCSFIAELLFHDLGSPSTIVDLARRRNVDEESSRAAFDGDWYLTGDLGFLLEGELYVTGRKKDLIIIAGHNVYPHDIEGEIGSLAAIKPGRAVAFGVYDDAEGTEKLVVMAEIDARSSSGAARLDEDALKSTIRDRMLSRFFVNVSDIRLFDTETLRKSTSGKLARCESRAVSFAPRRMSPTAFARTIDCARGYQEDQIRREPAVAHGG